MTWIFRYEYFIAYTKYNIFSVVPIYFSIYFNVIEKCSNNYNEVWLINFKSTLFNLKLLMYTYYVYNFPSTNF